MSDAGVKDDEDDEEVGRYVVAADDESLLCLETKLVAESAG